MPVHSIERISTGLLKPNFRIIMHLLRYSGLAPKVHARWVAVNCANRAQNATSKAQYVCQYIKTPSHAHYDNFEFAVTLGATFSKESYSVRSVWTL
jgi:hypothetical protein